MVSEPDTSQFLFGHVGSSGHIVGIVSIPGSVKKLKVKTKIISLCSDRLSTYEKFCEARPCGRLYRIEWAYDLGLTSVKVQSATQSRPRPGVDLLLKNCCCGWQAKRPKREVPHSPKEAQPINISLILVCVPILFKCIIYPVSS